MGPVAEERHTVKMQQCESETGEAGCVTSSSHKEFSPSPPFYQAVSWLNLYQLAAIGNWPVYCVNTTKSKYCSVSVSEGTDFGHKKKLKPWVYWFMV